MNIWFKEFLRNLLRYTSVYRKHKKLISVLDKNRDNKNLVAGAIKYAIDTTPFYCDYSFESCDINQLPIIRKNDLVGNEYLLLSKKNKKNKLRVVGTGGSTGISLTLYRKSDEIIKELAECDSVISQFIPVHRVIKCVLRGNRPKRGLYEYVSRKYHILSSYLLSKETVSEYISIIRSTKANLLHVYPTSLIIMCRIIKQLGIIVDLPDLKVIWASSEIFSREDKILVKSVFPYVVLIDYYGHNEMACAAYSVDLGSYKFLPTFGYVEFLPTSERVNDNTVAEIVCTSILNKTMPFIRYGTEDYVEIDKEGNVISIIGRSADFIINKDGNIVPCIVSTRDETLVNVINFQYHQFQMGYLEFRVMVNDKFGQKDIDNIMTDFTKSFDHKMVIQVTVVDGIPKTKIGKQKRLIQEINLELFR